VGCHPRPLLPRSGHPPGSVVGGSGRKAGAATPATLPPTCRQKADEGGSPKPPPAQFKGATGGGSLEMDSAAARPGARMQKPRIQPNRERCARHPPARPGPASALSTASGGSARRSRPRTCRIAVPGRGRSLPAGVQPTKLQAPKNRVGITIGPNGLRQSRPSRSDRRRRQAEGGSPRTWVATRGSWPSFDQQAEALSPGGGLDPQSDRVPSRKAAKPRSISAGFQVSRSQLLEPFCSRPPAAQSDQQALGGRARRALSLPAADPGPQTCWLLEMSPPTIWMWQT